MPAWFPKHSKLKGQGFIDVFTGDNGGNSTSCDDSFKTTGDRWDPAAGWGQPNFGLLQALVLLTIDS